MISGGLSLSLFFGTASASDCSIAACHNVDGSSTNKVARFLSEGKAAALVAPAASGSSDDSRSASGMTRLYDLEQRRPLRRQTDDYNFRLDADASLTTGALLWSRVADSLKARIEEFAAHSRPHAGPGELTYRQKRMHPTGR
jgi:hypothetical protein